MADNIVQTNDAKEPIIRLQSKDGVVFDVEVKVARLSCTIKTMLDDLGMDGIDEEIVPIPNVHSIIMRKIIEWATYHKDDPENSGDDKNASLKTDNICDWDANFLKVDQPMLFELILAANYLDIKGLLEITCKTVANIIQNKSTEDIRKEFNIKNDFTPAEEQAIINENMWCLEN